MGLPGNRSTTSLNVLIICQNASKMERVGQHLIKNGYPVKILNSIKTAINYIMTNKPQYVFVSWNINGAPKKLLRSLNQTFKIECIPFAEWPDRDTSKSLSRSGYNNIMLYPVSGQGIQRLIERLETAKYAKDDIKNLSKIQIKCTTEDVPTEGTWVNLPGKKNSWFLETQMKSRLFGKKNGRFIYHGDRPPEKLPNGRWKFDLIKGKLDFEIINVYSSKSSRELADSQANLTEAEALQKMSESLGQSIDDFDKQIRTSLVEEEIFQDESTKDEYGQNVDSLIGVIAKNLEEGFLTDQEKVNAEKEKMKTFMKETEELENYEDLNANYKQGLGIGVIKGEERKNKNHNFNEFEEENDLNINYIKGNRKNKSSIDIENKEEKAGYKIFEKDEKKDSGLVYQERQKFKDYSEVKKGFRDEEYSETQEAPDDLDYSQVQEGSDNLEYNEVQEHVPELEQNIKKSKGTKKKKNKSKEEIQEQYHPRLSGTHSALAKAIHAAHSQFFPVLDMYPKLVKHVKQVAIMCFDNKITKGYLVMATSKYEEYNQEELKHFHNHFVDAVKELNLNPKESDIAIIDVPEFDFKGWLAEKSLFASFVQNGENESVIAFIPAGEEMPSLVAEQNGHMVSINTKTIVPESKINFDLYLYLEKNQKFILYIKKNDKANSVQMNNLQQKQMKRFFIRIENAAAYRLYCAKYFIKEKIEEAVKFLKVG